MLIAVVVVTKTTTMTFSSLLGDNNCVLVLLEWHGTDNKCETPGISRVEEVAQAATRMSMGFS
jgi:hypothetical protein